jgi:hypothetical protein
MLVHMVSTLQFIGNIFPQILIVFYNKYDRDAGDLFFG